jgi:alpha-D-xyloside xylohydrolase
MKGNGLIRNQLAVNLFFRLLTASAIATTATADPVTPLPVTKVERRADGITIGTLRIQVWSDRVIRVTDGPATNSLSVIGQPGKASWKLVETPGAVVIETAILRAKLNRMTGAVTFSDRNDKLILEETERGKFGLAPDERIYGLGQHQAGQWNYRGTTVHLQQKNMEVALPVLVSSKGYGVLWDNPAVADVVVGPKQVEWRSEVGNEDYYFMYGPQADDVIRAYRELTGAAPMLPKWAWGFWQCKERYATQKELIDVVAEYRKRNVPLDGIVQDWQYWKPGAWGEHEFDPARYPEPAAMVHELHELNAHVLVSVWPRFDLGTAHLGELEQAGAVYPPVFPNVYPKGESKWYDAFRPEGRRIYWRQLSETLFKLGFDGWWLDASEPELGGHWGEMRHLNARFYNAYPLMHTTGIYQGQRAETNDKRVCILTRSAYPGQQRNAAITWSGDVQGSWDAFARQIPAGLNFSISGIPYWNTDIGGFFGKSAKDREYQELFTRWFEYGAFCPIFRVHGTGGPKEFWQWDGPTQEIWKKYVELRYRLLPYIYSVAWQVTSNGGTMMRPLMMDFPDALDVGDQFMFGPALLACPVTKEGATTRHAVLPGKSVWYDFWTGKGFTGDVEADAPIETMPLYVRAGSILPLGPVVQYTGEKPSDPIELRVYPGADGAFTLYEDEGDNYNYEKGQYATIPFTWNDATDTLTIGARERSFPGVLPDRTFHVVFVGANADHLLKYRGQILKVKK